MALFLATRKNGDTYNTVQNLTYQEIQNNYFTNLIATGATTAKDLEAISDIRPFGSLFIGVSKEPLTLSQAQELARRTGAALLQIEDSNSGTSQELTDWLRTTYASQLSATAWVRQTGEPRIFDSQSILPQPNDGQPRKVFLQWQGPDSLLSLRKKNGKAPQPTFANGNTSVTTHVESAEERKNLELQRKLAESILTKGGHVAIWQAGQVKSLSQLGEVPTGHFALWAVDTYGTQAIFSDEDARLMAGCNRLHSFRIHSGSMTFISFESLPELETIEISGSVMNSAAFRSLPLCRNMQRVALTSLNIDSSITQIIAQCSLLQEVHLGSKKLIARNFLPLVRLTAC